MSSAADIIHFWFQDLTDQLPLSNKNSTAKRWFIKDKNFDEEIRRRFEEDLMKAAAGEYRNWEETPHGTLALVILFDQFSRNMYRGTDKAFQYDMYALALSLQAIQKEDDLKLSLLERTFIYLPLEHDEYLETQKLSVKCFTDLVSESALSCPQNTAYFQYNLDYAKRHADIIERFGRFPHRNAILGRLSTKEEEAFLKSPNSSF